MEASNRKAKLVWGPHLLACSEDCLGQGRAQVSAHLVHSKAFLGELKQIFSNQPMLSPIVIATMQHAAMELVEFGMSVDDEKDFLLERVSLPSLAHAPCLTLFHSLQALLNKCANTYWTLAIGVIISIQAQGCL